MRTIWIKAAGILVCVWMLIGGAVWWARSAKPTPESLARYITEHPMNGKSGGPREKILLKVADQLNALDYEQRREMRVSRNLNGFFRTLSPEEQSRFLDLTLPANFKQTMAALNKMDPAKRKQIVEKTLSDMRRHEGEAPPPNNDDPNVQKIVQQGLQSFYSDASADVKLDFAPVIEQMQKNMQGFR